MMGSKTLDEWVCNQAVEMTGRKEFFDEIEGWFDGWFIWFGLFLRANRSDVASIPYFINVPRNDGKIVVNLIFYLILVFLFSGTDKLLTRLRCGKILLKDLV